MYEMKEKTIYACYWRIENFTLRYPKPDLYLESPVFMAGSLNSHWYLTIEQIQQEFIGVYLHMKSFTKPKYLWVSICLLKSSGWKVVEEKEFLFETGTGYGTHKLVSWQSIADDEWTYLPSGSLTICFNMFSEYLIGKPPAQWLMVSRMPSGKEDFKHLPVQKFRYLKPRDLLYFPASYAYYDC